jgi:hypothetical protein
MGGADPSKYGALIAHLSNHYAVGRDEYPSDETAAYNLGNYRTPENVLRPRVAVAQYNPRGHAATGPSVGSGITFAQQGSVAGNNHRLTHEGIVCFHCHSVGHYASNCPIGSEPTSGTTLTLFEYMIAQAPNASTIDPRRIMIDF